MPVFLDPESATPLYLQLKDLLLEQIHNGELKGGNKLPTEVELCELFHVSRNTVRTAIKDLTSEGYLTKKQGKGTFVQHKKIGENISSNLSFFSVCITNGMVPSNRLIMIALQPASSADISCLHIKPDSKVLYIARVLYADGIPVIYDRLYLQETYSEVLKENLNNTSLYALLYKKFGVVMKRSTKVIELALANEEEAALLNIRKGDPVLLMNETVYDNYDNPVHRTKQIILGDRFKYVVS